MDNIRLKKNKGLGSALTIVIAIIVLIIVAVAVIAVTTGSIADLASKEKNTSKNANPTQAACINYNNPATCISNTMCNWNSAENKCVPKS